MKSLLQTAAAALGYTFLAGIWLLGPVLDPAHDVLYHWAAPASRLFLPLLADFLLLWLAVTLLMVSARRPGLWRRTLWLVLLLFLPWLLLKKTLVLYSMVIVPSWLTWLLFALAVLLFAVLEAAWHPAWDERFERALGFAATCLVFAALPALFVFVQLGSELSHARNLNPTYSFDRPLPAAAAPPAGRVIWVVFDELSDSQTFDHRYPGLAMPAFDRLATESVRLDRVVPAGAETEAVLPALMTGLPVVKAASTLDGHLELRLQGASGLRPFDQRGTVFTDARRLGFHTAVAGWYNPYCRILPGVLDRCFWSDQILPWLGLSPDAGFTANMRAPLEAAFENERASSAIARLIGLEPRRNREAALHIQDARDLQAASDALLRDNRLGFVLIHLPVPHPPGIYDRAHARFSTDGKSSYIDNLALADAMLAHLRQVLEQTGQWDSTTLVIMGDHGWRWPLWNTMHSWQPEDQKARGERSTDLRPLYMIKLPGREPGTRLDAPFEAVHTRTLLDALMQGKLHTPQDLSAFLSAQTSRL